MQGNRETNVANYKRYLLGDLPPSETEAIDLQIISDEISEEKLLWAESELMEEYLDDTLSPPDVKLFKENFLISPDRIAQLKQISLLRNYARQSAMKDVSEEMCETLSESFLEKLKNFCSLNWRPLTAAFALFVVGLFAVFYLTANNRTGSEKEYAAINRKDLSDLAELKPLANLSLISGIYRDSGSVRKLAEEKLTEKVLFRLALPSQVDPQDKFKAQLLRDEKIVFTLDQLPYYNNPNGREIRLLLPATELKKGIYQIKIAEETSGEAVFVYDFAVE